MKRWRCATCACSLSAVEQEVRKLILARTVVLPAFEVVVESENCYCGGSNGPIGPSGSHCGLSDRLHELGSFLSSLGVRSRSHTRLQVAAWSHTRDDERILLITLVLTQYRARSLSTNVHDRKTATDFRLFGGPFHARRWKRRSGPLNTPRTVLPHHNACPADRRTGEASPQMILLTFPLTQVVA